MNTRKLTLSAILLAIGLALHYIIPGISAGMKIDTLLSMMFIAILLCEDYKSTLAISGAAGILTALTTTFPNGQIPNIIDKLVTGHVIFLLVIVTKRLYHQVRMLGIAILGTLVSGTVFLGSALLLNPLPAPFGILFTTVVLPAAVANSVLVVVVYNIVTTASRRTSFNLNR